MWHFFKKKKSREAAKARLTQVISRDRANVSAGFLTRLQEELVRAVQQFIQTDMQKVSVSVVRCGNLTKLLVDFPVLSYKEMITTG